MKAALRSLPNIYVHFYIPAKCPAGFHPGRKIYQRGNIQWKNLPPGILRVKNFVSGVTWSGYLNGWPQKDTCGNEKGASLKEKGTCGYEKVHVGTKWGEIGYISMGKMAHVYLWTKVGGLHPPGVAAPDIWIDHPSHREKIISRHAEERHVYRLERT